LKNEYVKDYKMERNGEVCSVGEETCWKGGSCHLKYDFAYPRYHASKLKLELRCKIYNICHY
jgi:hypothetical protein